MASAPSVHKWAAASGAKLKRGFGPFHCSIFLKEFHHGIT
jgi:hypothetical protein